ncbi:MAG: SRPBCC domain-containing protein [Flavipsychrobacter sp.]|nr:SRPBCC domain-containing protein [Flavipsychrobacter sp.]
MEAQNYHSSISVPVSADEAINKIARVSDWWAKNFEGSAQKLNDVFTVRFGETFVTFKIAEFVPDKKIVWQVTDCYLHWLNDKKEWLDTKVVWEVTSQNNTTQIDMTHIGLVPGAECYNDCFAGWTGHIQGSLYKLLTEGKGTPE